MSVKHFHFPGTTEGYQPNALANDATEVIP